MIGLAFELRWPAFVAARQQWRRDAAERKCGGEPKTLARSFFFGLLDVRNDFLWRLNHTAAQASERQRRAHQLQKRAPLDGIVPLFRSLREFALDEFFEHRRVGEFFQAAPVSLATAVLPGQHTVAQQLEIYVSIVIHFICSLSLWERG